MFSFFRKKAASPKNSFQFIGTDMHNHLLPGIDDGSPGTDTSLMLMEGMMELGFDRFYCTPHVLGHVHPNTPETIHGAHKKLTSALADAGFNVQTGCSAEYMTDYELADIIDRGEIVPLPGNHVLIEMSYAVESPNLREIIFQLQTKGYQPILAHPERYPFYFSRFDVYESLVDAGADLQLNILSLGGYYGKAIQKVAEKLLQENLISWLGTDMHHERHLEALRKMAGQSKLIDQLESIRNLRNSTL